MEKTKRNYRLWMKLTLMVLVTVGVTLLSSYVLLTKRLATLVHDNEETHLLQVARTIAHHPLVIESLTKDESSNELQAYALDTQKIFKLDFVVVINLAHLRLTHPDETKINSPFQGGDENLAFTGQESVSIAQGSLGESLRAFVPVYNASGKEVGVVAIGLKTTTLTEVAKRTMRPFTISLLISFVVGLAAAMFTAFTLKKQMYDLEPAEISRLLEERNAMLDYTKDAIVVTDSENKISLANLEAKRLFNLIADEGEIVGRYLHQFLPKLKKPNEIDENYQTLDELYHQNGIDYLLSAAPIIVRKKVIGQIITMRDATELFLLADQLLNTTAYATSLQTQSHSFLNKLHVIYGLTDLEEYEQLKIYLAKILEPEQEFSQRMVYLVHNPIIAGFLIGERSRFGEKNMPLMVEIYPDIPPTTENSDVQNWIRLMRILNVFFIEHNQSHAVDIRLGYWNQQLHTSFEVNLTKDLQAQLLKELDGPYFTKVLSRLAGQITCQQSTDWFKVEFTTRYEEEEFR